MPRNNNERSGLFDVAHGLASASLTAGKNIVATTGADYHGISMIASATSCVVTIYDNASATSGNIMDVFLVKTNSDVWIDRYIPVKGKNGITIDVDGAGARGAVFYGPKG